MILYLFFWGKCAEAVGLKLVHALDEDKRDYFHPFPPRDFFVKFVKDKYPNQTEFEPSQMRAVGAPFIFFFPSRCIVFIF